MTNLSCVNRKPFILPSLILFLPVLCNIEVSFALESTSAWEPSIPVQKSRKNVDTKPFTLINKKHLQRKCKLRTASPAPPDPLSTGPGDGEGRRAAWAHEDGGCRAMERGRARKQQRISECAGDVNHSRHGCFPLGTKNGGGSRLLGELCCATASLQGFLFFY